MEYRFNLLNMHQYAPINNKSQRGLNSNDYNIPAETGIKMENIRIDIIAQTQSFPQENKSFN